MYFLFITSFALEAEYLISLHDFIFASVKVECSSITLVVQFMAESCNYFDVDVSVRVGFRSRSYPSRLCHRSNDHYFTVLFLEFCTLFGFTFFAALMNFSPLYTFDMRSCHALEINIIRTPKIYLSTSDLCQKFLWVFS